MPWAPGNTWDFSGLNAGIASFGKNLSGFLLQRSEENKRILDTDKALMALRRANPHILDGAPFDEEDLSLMKPRDRVNISLGLLEANKQRNAQAMQEAQIGNMTSDNRRADLLAQMQGDKFGQEQGLQQADAAFLTQFLNGVQRNPDRPSAAFLEAAGRTPTSPLSHKLLEQMLTVGGRQKSAELPVQSTIGGRTVISSPTTGQFQVLPSDKMSADEKARYAGQLRGQKRGLLQAASRSDVDSAVKEQLLAEAQSIDDELSGLGFRTAAPPKPPAPAAAATAPNPPGLLQRVFGTTNPASAGKVEVVSPSGQAGYIPAAQLEEALQKGYKRAK